MIHRSARACSVILSLAFAMVAASGTAFAAERRTSFNPGVHGFAFANTFKNDFVREVDIRTGGLCGGMSYAALDYYWARKPIPRDSIRPAVQTELHDYIYDRQVTSLVENLDKWAEVGFNPLGARDSEFFLWGLQGFNGGRLQELRASIDRGRPVPLSLQAYGGDGRPGNHQVVAIGYDLGRYRGDLKAHKSDLKIFVYDPNYPNRTMTLSADLEKQGWYYRERRASMWRTYFVDGKYRAKTPTVAAVTRPVVSDGLVNELLLVIRTGGDDLRGGNDNVNVKISFRNGSSKTVNNLNRGRRWIDNYEQSVVVRLDRPVAPADITAITLTTTFSGGIGGDNWNMDCLRVIARGSGPNQTIYDREGTPVMRFTGERKTFVARPGR